jgi:hypothetical protein
MWRRKNWKNVRRRRTEPLRLIRREWRSCAALAHATSGPHRFAGKRVLLIDRRQAILPPSAREIA